MSILRSLGLSLGLLFLASGAWAACPTTSLTFKDAAGATQTLCFGGSAGAFIGQSELTSSSGAALDGTAGSAAAGVLSVQGIASMTPLLATVTNAGTFATQDSNLSGAITGSKVKVDIFGNSAATMDAAVGGAAAPTNALVAGGVYNSSPISVTATNAAALQIDSAGVLKIDCFTNCALAQASTTSGQLGSLVQGAVTTGQPVYTTAQTDPISLDVNGNTRVLNDGGCAGVSMLNTNYTPFSLASTTALKLVSKVAAKKVYICSINIVSASANNVALVEGTLTTTNCDTSTAGLAGGATAATGWNFAANGGLTLGNGVGLVTKSATANLDVCLFASGSGQVSGGITWAQF
jgi:hypothetical protein